MSEDFKINIQAVKELALLLKETDLTEIEYETDHAHIRVKKHQAAPIQQTYSIPMHGGEQRALQETVADATDKKNQDPNHHPGAVKSPMVGTVYLAPEPGAAQFVKIGDKIEKGQTLLIIEAMKVMNPIKAPKAGRLIDICIADTSPVEYNEVLMVIE
ncbi:MAG: acetyl-CoA carboxylase biotin carboxyl carrier protein [Alphaproteobacteria bacterium]|nr:acetyl-CoA carboxylase biotin carboxyl carrier protein [Alphaproteobacteria bacterium]